MTDDQITRAARLWRDAKLDTAQIAKQLRISEAHVAQNLGRIKAEAERK